MQNAGNRPNKSGFTWIKFNAELSIPTLVTIMGCVVAAIRWGSGVEAQQQVNMANISHVSAQAQEVKEEIHEMRKDIKDSLNAHNHRIDTLLLELKRRD